MDMRLLGTRSTAGAGATTGTVGVPGSGASRDASSPSNVSGLCGPRPGTENSCRVEPPPAALARPDRPRVAAVPAARARAMASPRGRGEALVGTKGWEEGEDGEEGVPPPLPPTSRPRREPPVRSSDARSRRLPLPLPPRPLSVGVARDSPSPRPEALNRLLLALVRTSHSWGAASTTEPDRDVPTPGDAGPLLDLARGTGGEVAVGSRGPSPPPILLAAEEGRSEERRVGKD